MKDRAAAYLDTGSPDVMRTRATGETSWGLPRWRSCQGLSRPLEGMRNTTAAWAARSSMRCGVPCRFRYALDIDLYSRDVT